MRNGERDQQDSYSGTTTIGRVAPVSHDAIHATANHRFVDRCCTLRRADYTTYAD
jgi:hypothetical protein